LKEYTNCGYRVLAIGSKKLDGDAARAARYTRIEVESNLSFIGFIVFENKLKKGTMDALRVLKEAEIRSVMCTGEPSVNFALLFILGDNLLTAIAVSRECGILPGDRNVYIPQLIETETSGTMIQWEDAEKPEMKLDSVTFEPLHGASSRKYALAVTGDVFQHLLDECPTEILQKVQRNIPIDFCLFLGVD
jgi:cation-transporting P-type ATPase 13A2